MIQSKTLRAAKWKIIAQNEQFLLSPQCFQNVSARGKGLYHCKRSHVTPELTLQKFCNIVNCDQIHCVILVQSGYGRICDPPSHNNNETANRGDADQSPWRWWLILTFHRLHCSEPLPTYRWQLTICIRRLTLTMLQKDELLITFAKMFISIR